MTAQQRGPRRHHRRRPDGPGARRGDRPLAGAVRTTRSGRALTAVCDINPRRWRGSTGSTSVATERLPATCSPRASTCSTSRCGTTCTSSSTSTPSGQARTSWPRSRSGSTSRRRADRRGDDELTRACSCAARARCRSSPGRSAPSSTSAAGLGARSSRRQRLPALERSRPQQADQLEAPGAFCGETGVMNDLGMHVAARAAAPRLAPAAVLRRLQDIVAERPGPDGEPVPCDTIENATLHCDAGFPLTLRLSASRPGRRTRGAAGCSGWTAAWSSARPTRRRCGSMSGTASRSGRGWRSAASRPSRPSPAASSSSASRTRSCRCGRPTWPSGRARSTGGSAA